MKWCSHGYVFQQLDALEPINGWLNQPEVLRKRMAEDGYLYLTEFLDPEDVLRARAQLLHKLLEHGFIGPVFPLPDAVSLGRKRLPLNGKSELSKTLRTLPELIALSQHPKLMGFFETFLGGPS